MEFLKANSDFLRGTIEQSLANPITGSITQDDATAKVSRKLYAR